MVYLKEHNKVVYARIREVLKYMKQIALVQATGTGKTFVMMKLLNPTE